MTKRLALILLLFSIINSCLLAQDYFFRHFSVEDGMPQSSAHCLMQDSRGFIWIGTDGAGVSVFDGFNFRTYNKSSGLSGNTVWSLFEDSRGNIWMGTENGLTIYDGLDITTIGSEDGLVCGSVLRFAENQEGIIWAATNDAGLYGISRNDTTKIWNFSQSAGLVSNFIYDIHIDDKGKIWLAMVGGLNIIEFEEGSYRNIKEIHSPLTEANFLLSMEPADDGSIFIGTYENGLFRINEDKTGGTFSVDYPFKNESLQEIRVWDLLQKDNGQLLAATDKNGVIILRDHDIEGIYNNENGMLSNQVLDMIKDDEGNIWFATMGQGISMFDDEKFLRYSEDDGIPGKEINDILPIDKRLVIATNEGVTIFLREGDELVVDSSFETGSGLAGLSPNTVIDKGEELWLGTDNGIYIIEGDRIREFELNNELTSQKINCLLYGSDNTIWAGTEYGYSKISGEEVFSLNEDQGFINNEVMDIIQDARGRVWMGTLGGLVMIEGNTYTDYNEEDGLTELQIHSLAEDASGNIWIGSFGDGIFMFDTDADSIPVKHIASTETISSNNIYSLLFINDSTLVASTDKGIDILSIGRDTLTAVHYNMNDGFSAGESNLNSVAEDRSGFVWFGTSDGLIRYDPRYDNDYKMEPGTAITGVRMFFEEVDWKSEGYMRQKWFNIPDNLVLGHNDNHVTFDFTGFCYHDPDDLEFSYFLEGQSKDWSPYDKRKDAVFSGLPPGDYVFKVKSRNRFGSTGETAELAFTIKPPFWMTTWFIVLVALLVVALLILFIKLRERALVNEKLKLEKIVDERTKEVVQQKDEIERQRDIVVNQKQEITSSIEYAETIQIAVLPDVKILERAFSDYFILFRPKDIVSGDFYWMSRRNDHVVFTACDCTGHGVPGAFMSLLGVSFLNKIVNESGEVIPEKVLGSLRDNVINSLKQKGMDESSKDGMDIALCTVNFKARKLYFAGANNPVYIIRGKNGENELIEIKADRMPVGFHPQMTPFTNHEFDLQKGDSIYMFSDGYVDQFGGEQVRKFMKKQFKQILLDNQNKSMAEQKQILELRLDEWIETGKKYEEGLDQIDDIIVMGVKIP